MLSELLAHLLDAFAGAVPEQLAGAPVSYQTQPPLRCQPHFGVVGSPERRALSAPNAWRPGAEANLSTALLLATQRDCFLCPVAMPMLLCANMTHPCI